MGLLPDVWGTVFDAMRTLWDSIITFISWLTGTFKFDNTRQLLGLAFIFFFMFIAMLFLIGGGGIGSSNEDAKGKPLKADIFTGLSGLRELTPCIPGTEGDVDCDGVPDGEDGDMDGDGTPNNEDSDQDGDGLVDAINDPNPYGGTDPGVGNGIESINLSAHCGNGRQDESYDTFRNPLPNHEFGVDCGGECPPCECLIRGRQGLDDENIECDPVYIVDEFGIYHGSAFSFCCPGDFATENPNKCLARILHGDLTDFDKDLVFELESLPFDYRSAKNACESGYIVDPIIISPILISPDNNTNTNDSNVRFEYIG